MGKMMVKSNQVQLLKGSHTRALFGPKMPYRAKITGLQGA